MGQNIGGNTTKTITFNCETVTPVFLAGADGRTPELRPPSIKGMMRFWWRALHGHMTIENLKKEEAKIFGTSDEKIGRSKFSIRVNKQLINNDIVKSLWEEIPFEERTSKIGNKYKVPKKYEGISYLLYSIFMVNERPYIKSGTLFSIQVSLYNDEILQELINSVYVLAFFGGLGSRNRRGAGSFRLRQIISDKDEHYQKMLDTNNILSVKDLEKYIKSNINPMINSCFCSSYSVLKNSKIYILDPKNNWKDALEIIGEPFLSFRKTNKARVSDTPNFGFPVVHKNYPKITMGAGHTNDKGNVVDFIERRASPLIFKVIKTNDMTYFPVIIWLNSELAPSNYNIMSKYGHNVKRPNEKIITEFLTTIPKKLEVIL